MLDVGADVEVGALEDAAVDVVRCDDVDVAEGVDAVDDDVPDAGFDPSSDEQPVRTARPEMNVMLTLPRVLMPQR